VYEPLSQGTSVSWGIAPDTVRREGGKRGVRERERGGGLVSVCERESRALLGVGMGDEALSLSTSHQK
jgi:hypothetical protein